MKTWLAINKDLYNIPQLAATVCSDIQFFFILCCINSNKIQGYLLCGY